MKYDILLLDADDTLFDFGLAEREAIRRVCRQRGLPASDAVCDRYSEINLSLWKKFEQGLVTQDRLRAERFEILLTELDARDDAHAFSEAYTDALGEGAFLLPGAYELCKELSARCPLYIVTNGVIRTQKNRLAHSQIAPFISRMFISQELGAPKPRREFFDRVFEALGGPDRSRAIILGDSLTSDMAGGRNAGIACCWLAPSGAEGDPALYDYRIDTLSGFIPIVMGES
ncbi:YjjG family noncanonical pyrimidine nucleotidase [Anaerotruncus rubiinfantis]|uniref:YjjG family noncanonical pyrimidine nucleotidase n=1 Tax=Anaerotruncus rubiinfantis TaxID=1720200 RepID=UPI0034A5B9D6